MLNTLPEDSTDSLHGEGLLSRINKWLSKFVEVEEDDEDAIANGDRPSKDRLQQTLRQCVHYFDCLFQTELDNQVLLKNDLDSSMNESFISPARNCQSLNISDVNENLRNNMHNVHNLEYMGDPLVRPIQPHENKFLCRNLHKLSLFLNRKFEPQLLYLSENEDEKISQFASVFLNKRPPPGPFERPNDCEKPHFRINLRPLSSYKTLALISLACTTPYLIGGSFHFILFSLIFLVILILLPIIVFIK